ncbi:uncharacterized protein [Pseudorasbora parva]|uniref:uncharacterized protein n=1 Tax=Pseudorasbora parva TaxID=51549 RepID=UPI00351E6486
MSECIYEHVAIALTSIGLLISVCLNVAFYLLRRKGKISAANENMFDYGEEPLRRDSLQSYRFEDDEMERQENPIYGNICIDGGGAFEMSPEMCYEQMSQASTVKQGLKVQQGDVSYASLDLTVNKKRKKKRKYQRQAHQAQTHPQPTSQQHCMDQDNEADVTLPSRSSSLMVSRHSIYLNSHQVALEAEEMERERERMKEMERDDNAEREFEMRRNLHEGFDHSPGRSRQSLEQDS